MQGLLLLGEEGIRGVIRHCDVRLQLLQAQ